MNPQIDYLALFAEREPMETPVISYHSESLKSKIFAKTESVRVSGTLIGYLASEPMSSILPPKSCLFKFENNILYSSRLEIYIQILSELCGFYNMRISRLDLCIDLNYFLNFRDPWNFIKDCLSEKFVKTGRTKFKVIGIYNQSLSPQYLRFGSNHSPIAVYLYNKSIEMKEKKFKSYIFDQWTESNLNLEKPVWRLEFSIKGNNHSFIDKTTGELIAYTYRSILCPAIRSDIFNSLLSKYFTFKRPLPIIKFRSWPTVKLFDDIQTDTIHINSEPGNDLTRSNKIFIKHFELYLSELRESNTALTMSGLEVLAQYSKDFNLKKYQQFISKF